MQHAPFGCRLSAVFHFCQGGGEELCRLFAGAPFVLGYIERIEAVLTALEMGQVALIVLGAGDDEVHGILLILCLLLHYFHRPPGSEMTEKMQKTTYFLEFNEKSGVFAGFF